MIGEMSWLPELQRPEMLLAIVPWLALVYALFRRHRTAFSWLHENVSPRFLGRYSAYRSTRSLRRHFELLALLGALLAVAAAGPSFEGEVEASGEGGDVLILLDASQSMNASDVAVDASVEVPGRDEDEETRRFDIAVMLARELVASLPDHRFALFTWSGSAAPELPMTEDRRLIEDALHHVELHTTYQTSGSSFAVALDAVLPFTGKGRALQVIFLGDGEQPFEEDYEDVLRAVVEAGVAVHGMAIGSEEGQGRTYTNVSEEEKPFKTDFHTRRVDRHLESMARRSDGHFTTVASYPASVAVAEIRDAVRSFEPRPSRLDEELAKGRGEGRDLGRVLMLPFLLLFLLHTLLVGRRIGRGSDHGGSGGGGFDLDRLGPDLGGDASSRRPPGVAAQPRAGLRNAFGVLLAPSFLLLRSADGQAPPRAPSSSVRGAFLLLALAACAPSLLELAHRANERGLALDAAGITLARPHFERSRAYGVEAQIPTFNLARGLAADGQFAEAHELFEEAMQLEPELVEAPFADGVALFDWGESERDPRGCELDRTRELWQASLDRFEALEEGGEHDYRTAAIENAEAVRRALSEIEKLIEEPPEACQEEPPPPEECDDPDAGGGGGAGDTPPPPPGAPPPPPPGGDSGGNGDQPPPPAGGLSPEEQQQAQQALQRIQQNTRRENVFHRRTAEQQWRSGVKATEKVWW